MADFVVKSAIARLSSWHFPMTNCADRTIWTGDNLDILCGVNSASVYLIYLDSPFGSNRNYVAPVGSAAARGLLGSARKIVSRVTGQTRFPRAWQSLLLPIEFE